MNNSFLLSLVGAALLRLQGTHGTPSERNISSDRDKVLDEWKDQARAGNQLSRSLKFQTFLDPIGSLVSTLLVMCVCVCVYNHFVKSMD